MPEIMLTQTALGCAPHSLTMQAMGHADPKMFDKKYRSQVVRWDIQNTFLGQENRMSVVLAAGDTARSRDPRAPKGISEEQHLEILDLPTVVQLRSARLDLVNECTRRYGSITGAEKQGAEVAVLLQQAVRAYKNEIRNQRNLAKIKLRAEWFEDEDNEKNSSDNSGDDSSNDNNSSDDDSVQVTIPREAPPSLPERVQLARVLFEPFSTIENATERRIAAISNMGQLCSRREERGQTSFPLAVKRFSEDCLRSSVSRYSLHCKPSTCLFCLGRRDAGVLSTYVRLSRHLEKVHYRYLKKKHPFECPHPACKEKLQHIFHFQLHATQTH